MYKNLVIVAIFIFIFGGGYLIQGAGNGIIGDIILGGNQTEYTLIPITEEQVSGVYTCDTVTTCKNKYTLTLKEDKTAELTKILHPFKKKPLIINQNIEENEGDQISSTEKGNWEMGIKNMLIITITSKEEDLYDVPQKIVIKNIGTNTLSNVNYTKENYKDIEKFIFIKQ